MVNRSSCHRCGKKNLLLPLLGFFNCDLTLGFTSPAPVHICSKWTRISFSVPCLVLVPAHVTLMTLVLCGVTPTLIAHMILTVLWFGTTHRPFVGFAEYSFWSTSLRFVVWWKNNFLMLWPSPAVLPYLTFEILKKWLCLPLPAFWILANFKRHRWANYLQASASTSSTLGVSISTLMIWISVGVMPLATSLLYEILTPLVVFYAQAQEVGIFGTPLTFTSPTQPYIMRMSCHKALPPNYLPWPLLSAK